MLELVVTDPLAPSKLEKIISRALTRTNHGLCPSDLGLEEDAKVPAVSLLSTLASARAFDSATIAGSGDLEVGGFEPRASAQGVASRTG